MTSQKSTVITADNLYAVMLVYKRWFNNLFDKFKKR